MLGLVERLERQRRKVAKYAGGGGDGPPKYPGSVAQTYELLYPDYLDAPHLAPLRELFERAKRGERLRVCVSYPPRAGKTETVIAGMVDRLLWNVESRIAYVTYGQKFSEKKSARTRQLARQHGVPIDPTTRSKRDWATGYGEGGLWATSTGGQITGMGFELAVLDDLLSGREDAESVTVRDTAWATLKADIGTRMEPDGAIILNGTRWHDDDPIGRAANEGWEVINVPALDELDMSYWPARWDNAHLHQIRTELGGAYGYEWSSLYMGNPRAQGERIFQDAVTVPELPPGRARIGIGVDFAYTVAKSSDYSVAVVLAEIGGVYYVIDVARLKVSEEKFRARVGELAALYEAQFVVGYVAATEQANITLLQRDDLAAFGTRAIRDKKVHALPTAAGWNLGRIKVLAGKAWTAGFCKEVAAFTGADRRDDQVDALATVYDAMFQSAPIDWTYASEFNAAAPRAFSLSGCN